MNREYVQQYVALEKKHWWFIARKKIICRFIDQNVPGSNLRILNIGAAGGASSEWLSKYGAVLSVENDPWFLEHLRQNNIDVIEASIDALPFADEYFDMVCAFDVLEHVGNDRQALLEMQRVCKTEGHLVLTVPALPSLWSKHDVVNEHKRRYTRLALKSLIRPTDPLRLKILSYFNFILLPPIYLARKVSNLFFSKKAESDFQTFKVNKLVNPVFERIFSFETFLSKWFRFPGGVSLIAVIEKTRK